MTVQEKNILQKLCKFCAYRERAKAEIVEKLLSLDVPRSKHKQYIDFLTNENFINENRFAEYYVHGKLHNNKWGINKIKTGLYERKVDRKAIEHGLKTIHKEEYILIIEKLITSKKTTVKGKNTFEKNSKIAKYLIQKGFESPLVWKIIKEKSSPSLQN